MKMTITLFLILMAINVFAGELETYRGSDYNTGKTCTVTTDLDRTFSISRDGFTQVDSVNASFKVLNKNPYRSGLLLNGNTGDFKYEANLLFNTYEKLGGVIFKMYSVETGELTKVECVRMTSVN